MKDNSENMSVDSIYTSNDILKKEVFSIEQGDFKDSGSLSLSVASKVGFEDDESTNFVDRASYYAKHSIIITGNKSADLMFKRCLMFAGIKKPAKKLSLWWLAYVGWRLVFVCGLISIIANIFTFRHKKPWLVPYCLVPSMLAFVCAGMSWYWLPKVRRKLVAQGGPEITAQDANQASRLYIRFVGINLVLGVVLAFLRWAKTDLYVFVIVLFQQCGTTVILGGVLLVLTIETTLAKKEVRNLLYAARKKTLTRSMYLDGVETIKLRSLRWQWPLNSLAFVAFYCSVCLVIIQMFLINQGEIRTNLYSLNDDDEASAVEIEAEIVMVLMKEFVLLIIFMFLIMGINDEADAITTELLTSTWGLPGSPEESIRQDLLFHTTLTTAAPTIDLTDTFDLAPRNRSFHGGVDIHNWNTESASSWISSWYFYFFTPKIRPITFKILGFRITRGYVVAAFASLLLAVVNVLVRLSMY